MSSFNALKQTGNSPIKQNAHFNAGCFKVFPLGEPHCQAGASDLLVAFLGKMRGKMWPQRGRRLLALGSVGLLCALTAQAAPTGVSRVGPQIMSSATPLSSLQMRAKDDDGDEMLEESDLKAENVCEGQEAMASVMKTELQNHKDGSSPWVRLLSNLTETKDNKKICTQKEAPEYLCKLPNVDESGKGIIQLQCGGDDYMKLIGDYVATKNCVLSLAVTQTLLQNWLGHAGSNGILLQLINHYEKALLFSNLDSELYSIYDDAAGLLKELMQSAVDGVAAFHSADVKAVLQKRMTEITSVFCALGRGADADISSNVITLDTMVVIRGSFESSEEGALAAFKSSVAKFGSFLKALLEEGGFLDRAEKIHSRFHKFRLSKLGAVFSEIEPPTSEGEDILQLMKIFPVKQPKKRKHHSKEEAAGKSESASFLEASMHEEPAAAAAAAPLVGTIIGSNQPQLTQQPQQPGVTPTAPAVATVASAPGSAPALAAAAPAAPAAAAPTVAAAAPPAAPAAAPPAAPAAAPPAAPAAAPPAAPAAAPPAAPAAATVAAPTPAAAVSVPARVAVAVAPATAPPAASPVFGAQPAVTSDSKEGARAPTVPPARAAAPSPPGDSASKSPKDAGGHSDSSDDAESGVSIRQMILRMATNLRMFQMSGKDLLYTPDVDALDKTIRAGYTDFTDKILVVWAQLLPQAFTSTTFKLITLLLPRATVDLAEFYNSTMAEDGTIQEGFVGEPPVNYQLLARRFSDAIDDAYKNSWRVFFKVADNLGIEGPNANAVQGTPVLPVSALQMEEAGVVKPHSFVSARQNDAAFNVAIVSSADGFSVQDLEEFVNTEALNKESDAALESNGLAAMPNLIGMVSVAVACAAFGFML